MLDQLESRLLRPVLHDGQWLHPDGRITKARRPTLQERVGAVVRRLREEAGAITVSGMYILTWIDVLDTTQLAVDMDLDTHKIALFTNTITPNFSTDTAYAVAPYNANEVTSANWAAGGVVVAGTTVTESPTGTIMWDATDTSANNTTLTNARGGLIYADALAGNNALMLINFGADYSTNNGTFTITWAATGIMTWDITP